MDQNDEIIERIQRPHKEQRIQEKNRRNAPGTGSDKQHDTTPTRGEEPFPSPSPKPDEQKKEPNKKG